MATAAAMPRGAGEIKLEYGRTEVFGLKYVAGKNVEGKFGPRVLFTLSDERKLWLDPEDGSDLERAVEELGMRAGEEIRVTKIRHARGGGHSLRIERAGDSSFEDTEAMFERSLQPRRRGPEAVPARPAADPKACLMQAIDALAEAQRYAAGKGMEIRFGAEDVRAMAFWLSECPGEGRR